MTPAAKAPQGRAELPVTTLENHANVRCTQAEGPGDLLHGVSLVVRLFKDPPMQLWPGFENIHDGLREKFAITLQFKYHGRHNQISGLFCCNPIDLLYSLRRGFVRKSFLMSQIKDSDEISRTNLEGLYE
jgi:hypothetical protein